MNFQEKFKDKISFIGSNGLQELLDTQDFDRMNAPKPLKNDKKSYQSIHNSKKSLKNDISKSSINDESIIQNNTQKLKAKEIKQIVLINSNKINQKEKNQNKAISNLQIINQQNDQNNIINSIDNEQIQNNLISNCKQQTILSKQTEIDDINQQNQIMQNINNNQNLFTSIKDNNHTNLQYIIQPQKLTQINVIPNDNNDLLQKLQDQINSPQSQVMDPFKIVNPQINNEIALNKQLLSDEQFYKEFQKKQQQKLQDVNKQIFQKQQKFVNDFDKQQLQINEQNQKQFENKISQKQEQKIIQNLQKEESIIEKHHESQRVISVKKVENLRQNESNKHKLEKNQKPPLPQSRKLTAIQNQNSKINKHAILESDLKNQVNSRASSANHEQKSNYQRQNRIFSQKLDKLSQNPKLPQSNNESNENSLINSFALCNPYSKMQIDSSLDNQKQFEINYKNDQDQINNSQKQIDISIISKNSQNSQYKRKFKNDEQKKLGGLGPNINTEEWIDKTNKVNQVKVFSKYINALNQMKSQISKPLEKIEEKVLSKRDKAIQFAKQIKLPKPLKEKEVIIPAVRYETQLETFERIHHELKQQITPEKINSQSHLELLQKKHIQLQNKIKTKLPF